MVRLLTVHEFVDACDKKCITHKDRCERYHSVKDYLPTLETRHEHRKDILACEALTKRHIQA